MSRNPVELCAKLDRDVAAAVGAAPPMVVFHVDRKGDDAFDVTVMVSVPQGTFRKQVGSWNHTALDLACVRAIVAWSKPKMATGLATFTHWSGWTGSYEKNARELLRVFDGKPTNVTVNRGTPYTERGEPPVGQPSFTLAIDADGVSIESTLFWGYTDESDHERVLAGIQKSAIELAATLGVPCKTV